MDPLNTLVGPRYCRLEKSPNGVTKLTVFLGDSSTHDTNKIFYEAHFQDYSTAELHAKSWMEHGRPYEEKGEF